MLMAQCGGPRPTSPSKPLPSTLQSFPWDPTPAPACQAQMPLAWAHPHTGTKLCTPCWGQTRARQHMSGLKSCPRPLTISLGHWAPLCSWGLCK